MRILRTSAALGAVLLLAAACGTSGSTAAGGGGSGAVTTSNASGVGLVLVDSSGKTLYFTDGETTGSVKCTGACLGFWQPLTLPANAAPKASADLTAMLGQFVRAGGGTRQVTYAGHPLYTFKLDGAAGQAAGNGVTDHFGTTTFTWHAVRSDGSAAAVGGGASPSSGYSRGYGY